MTRYEELKNKAELCRKAALITRGKMRYIWLDKYTELNAMAEEMTVEAAANVLGSNGNWAGYAIRNN